MQLFTEKILSGFSHVFRRLVKVKHYIDFSDKDTKNNLMEAVHKNKGMRQIYSCGVCLLPLNVYPVGIGENKSYLSNASEKSAVIYFLYFGYFRNKNVLCGEMHLNACLYCFI